MSNFEPIRTRKGHYPKQKDFVRPPEKCRNKTSYKTHARAEKQRLYILKHHNPAYLRIYKCFVCHRFHLTKQPQRK